MTPHAVRLLLLDIRNLRPDEIGCDSCYEQVAAFADATLAGCGAVEALPLVADHLARCSACRSEFEALLDALHAIEGDASALALA